jgi:amidase
MTSSWQSISRRKKQEQLSRIPKEYVLPGNFFGRINILGVPRSCGLLTSQQLHITENFDATALAKEIKDGSLTSVEVAEAFCKRAAIAHQLVCSYSNSIISDVIPLIN